MPIYINNFLLILVLIALVGCATTTSEPPPADLFQTLLGKSEAEVQAKIDAAWAHFFYGNDNTQRVYYPVGDDMAYVMDIGNNDVRTEGISYGMMIAVQMDKQEEFNRIWKWAKTYMYQEDGQYAGYFSWHNTPDGEPIHVNPASDGEAWLVTALFFAAHRWGNGEGIFNYEAEANQILQTMLHKDKDNTLATAMFNPEHKVIVFVPKRGRESQITDPSYHTPHYYQLWAEWAAADNDFWREATTASRAFLKTAAHPKTGLMPDYAEFDGRPVQYGGGHHDSFSFDAWRTTMNIALDYNWNQADPWAVEHSNQILEFFWNEGLDSYNSEYSLAGEPLSSFHSPGLVATNAVGALAATHPNRADFAQALWDLEPPSGQWRYYDGLLYFMALLMVSGRFQVY